MADSSEQIVLEGNDEIMEVLSDSDWDFYDNVEKQNLEKKSKVSTKKRLNADKKHSKNNAQQKNSKETTKDRLLEWNNFYSTKKFGIWIQCTKCTKWRESLEYEESHQVPIDWCCEMSTTSSEKGCNDPEMVDTVEFSPGDFIPGSIVWAKVDGYPWWPGMVEDDPDIEEYYWSEGKAMYYNITFLDDKVTHAWVPQRFVCSYLNPPPQRHLIEKWRAKYAHLIQAAEKKAKIALTMPIKERLQNFSFAKQYKGKWPKACNFDDDDETTENITEMLIKEVEEIESIKFSESEYETDDSREEIKESNPKHKKIFETKQIHLTRDVKASSKDKKEIDFNKVNPENSNQEIIFSEKSCEQVVPKLDSKIGGENVRNNICKEKGKILETDKIETFDKEKSDKSHHVLSEKAETELTKIISRKADEEESKLSNIKIYENQKKLLNTNKVTEHKCKDTNKRKNFEKQASTTNKKKKDLKLSEMIKKDEKLTNNKLSSKNMKEKRKPEPNKTLKPLKKAFLPPVKDSSNVMNINIANKESCIKISSSNNENSYKGDTKILNSGMKVDNRKTLKISSTEYINEGSKPEVSAEFGNPKSEMPKLQKFNEEEQKNCNENYITNDHQTKKQISLVPTDLIVKKNIILHKKEQDKYANIKDKETKNYKDNKQIRDLHARSEYLDQTISELVAELMSDEDLLPEETDQRKESRKPTTKKKISKKNKLAVNCDSTIKDEKLNIKSKNEHMTRNNIPYTKPNDESPAKNMNKRKIQSFKSESSELSSKKNITEVKSILRSHLQGKIQHNCISDEIFQKNTITDEEIQKSSKISDIEDTDGSYSLTLMLNKEQPENEDSDPFETE